MSEFTSKSLGPSTPAETPPPPLWAEHRAELLARGIPPEYAIARGVSSIDWGEILTFHERNGNTAASRRDGELSRYRLPAIPTTGILIEYPQCLDGVQRYRLRSDLSEYVKTDEEHRELDETVNIPRYICQYDISIAPYIIQDVLDVAADASVPICIVEAPLKALSLSANGMLAIGLGGVLAGAHDRDVAQEMGEILAHEELRRINWRGRDAFIVFDAGIRDNPLVALGAAYVGEALRREEANVRILFLPYFHPQNSDPEKGLFWRQVDQGPDDYLARNGAAKLLQMIADDSVPADPVERARHVLALNTKDPGESAGSFRSRQAEALSALLREPFFAAALHLGGDAVVAAVGAIAADAKVGVRALRSSVSEFQKALGKRQKGEENSDYSVQDGRLCYLGEPVTNFNASIVGDTLADDGDAKVRVFEIEGRLASGPPLPRVQVKAAEFGGMKWVHELWGAEAIVAAGKTAADRARAAIQTLSTPMKRAVYAHTGWREVDGKRTFLLPGGGITADGRVDLDVDVKLPGYHCPDPPSSSAEAQEAWLASNETLVVADLETTTPLLAMMYLAPLRHAFEGIPFALWFVAPTGSHKSTIVGLMLSHFGSFAFNKLPGSWFSTATALEAEMAATADVPFVIDDFTPPGADEIEVRRQLSLAMRVVQTVGNGQTRSRCNSDGTRKAQRRPRCGLISTAEVLQMSAESALGRLHVVEGHTRAKTNLDQLTKCQRSARLLSVNMGGYIRWLAGIEDLPGKVDAIFEPLRGGLQSMNAGHARTPTSTAMLLTGLRMWTEYGRAIGLDLDRASEADLYDVLVAQADAQPRPEHKTATDTFVDALRSMLGSKYVALASSPGDARTPTDDGVVRIGWLTESEILLDPTETLRQVQNYLGKRWGYTDSELKRQLKTATARCESETGVGVVPILKAQEAKQLTVQRTVRGGRARVWVVDRRLFAAETYEGLRVVAANEGEDVGIGPQAYAGE
jgi:hypothetical protein